MSPISGSVSLASVTLSVLLAGCAVIIPAKKETIVSGQVVAAEEVRSSVSIGEHFLDVKARLGDPVVNVGPQRVYVYKWTIQKGRIFWTLGYGYDLEPWVVSHLLFIAFDQNGKVLQTGTKEYRPANTMTEQVREWLSSSGLAIQVPGPRAQNSSSRGPALFVYRLSDSPCPFPTFDSNTFMPSVAVDGTVIGDLLRGQYLASEILPGAHVITIDPLPYYQFEGQEKGRLVPFVRAGVRPTTVHVSVDPELPVYVETYLCTGTGKIEVRAAVRDAPSALEVLRKFKPAW